MLHVVSDAGIYDSRQEGSGCHNKHAYIKKRFPPWNLALAAFVGAMIILWDWWTLVRQRCEKLFTIVLVSILGMWGYAVYGLLGWDYKL